MVLLVFVLGTVLMRSAGCVLNDIADAGFDSHVERTKDRPLAAGKLSRKEALVLAAALAICAFALVLFLNMLTIALSFAALFLAATYPYTKRFFSIPQAYLGIAFGFGIPMAFAAQTGQVPPLAWVLLTANIFWAIAYDTEYAMVDREDDLKIGIKTSAITFGRFDVTVVMLCYGVMLAIFIGVGLHLHMSWAYYAGLATAAALMSYHYLLIRDRDAAGCFKAFKHNNWVGAAIFAGLAAHYLMAGQNG